MILDIKAAARQVPARYSEFVVDGLGTRRVSSAGSSFTSYSQSGRRRLRFRAPAAFRILVSDTARGRPGIASTKLTSNPEFRYTSGRLFDAPQARMCRRGVSGKSKWEGNMKTKTFLVCLLSAVAVRAQQRGVPRVAYFSGVHPACRRKAANRYSGDHLCPLRGAAGWRSLVVRDSKRDAGRAGTLHGAAGVHGRGLPLELFASGKARWLGVAAEVADAAERPRILLVGVPYALKAADADTLGGLPASAFLQARSAGAAAGNFSARPDAAGSVSPNTACSSVTSDGTATANQIALFTTARNIEPSTIVESSGKVGIGTTANPGALTVIGVTTLAASLTIDTKGKASSSAGGQFLSGWFRRRQLQQQHQRFRRPAIPVAGPTGR